MKVLKTSTQEKGLGIGLYQCKQIVEAHGGRIEVESREGAGTVFTAVVPGVGSALMQSNSLRTSSGGASLILSQVEDAANT